MQEKVCKGQIKDINDLCSHIMAAWNEPDQRIIDDTAVRQWCTCLHACVNAKGCHSECKWSEYFRMLLLLITAYCKTLYFRCILISRFWNAEISLHFNLAFSQCSTFIYQTFDGKTEFLRVFNFAILSYSRNSQKFNAREKCVLQ